MRQSVPGKFPGTIQQCAQPAVEPFIEKGDLTPAAPSLEKNEPAESAKQIEKTAPTVKAPETPGQKLRRRIAQQTEQANHRIVYIALIS